MANVTQKIPSLLGGVSRLADFDKKDDEVREAINCYPDLSYGLTKRPGTQFMGALGITEEEAEQTYFFPLIREGRDRYLVGLRDADSLEDSIKIWNLDDNLSAVTVNAKEGQELGYGYLDFVSGINSISQNDAYRVASDDKRTVIVNRTKVCLEDKTEWQNLPVGFEWTPRGFKRNVNSIDDLPGGEVFRVNWGYGGEDNVQENPLRPGIHYLPTSVMPAKLNGQVQETKATGLVLKCNIDENGAIVFKGAYRQVNGERVFVEYDGSADFDQPGDQQIYDATVWAKGTAYPDQTLVSIDGVTSARCSTATGLLPGYVYRVINSGSNLDDAYFQPFSNTSDEDDAPGGEPPNQASLDGPYYWKECPSPDSYAGLNQETLPHELIDNQDGTFTFGQLDYSNRWAGNNANNPAPSFIDNRINGVFFLNNRLAFLSEDNVILSRPINYGPEGTTSSEYVPDDNPWVRRNYSEVDFFRQSAMGLTAADPIDLKVASNNTSILQKAIPTPQGTILFSDGQQSLLFQPQGLLSPLTASINSISNYDMTDDVEPIIVGETCYFINKGANFCRIYSLVNRGMQDPPIIEDVTKEVSDWLPNNLTDMRASLTDDMLLTYARDYRTIYCRRVVTEENSSWTKWVMPDSLVEVFVDHDEVFYLTKTDGSVQVHRADMYVVPDDALYSFSPINEIEEVFNGIPDDYDFSKKLIGYKQLKPGKFGTIEYYAPWHDYYENGTQNQYDRWLSLENIGWTSAIVSAFYSVEVDLANTVNWNVGYRIKVKLKSNNEVVTLPSDGASQRLPYDTIFRINSGSNLASDYIDGCVETTECSVLKYMTPEGFVNDTYIWGNKIEEIDTSSDPVVVTLRHCDGEPANEVSIPKDDFYDAFLLNIAKNNCGLNPEDFKYARIVIDDATLSKRRKSGTTYNPATILKDSEGFEYVESRSVFPIKDYWYEKEDSDGPRYIGTLAASVSTNNSLGCAGPNWGRVDDFFCQQNPGTLLGGAQISYTSSENYSYNYSTNRTETYPDTRPDINRSGVCQLRDPQYIGEYTVDGDGDPNGLIGKKWGTYNYVAPVTLDARDWYSRDYYNYFSGCSDQDKFQGYILGGWSTRWGQEPNVSGFDTPGWAYDGYNKTSPYEFLGAPELYEDPGTSLQQFYISFDPPYYGKPEEDETSQYQDYLDNYGTPPRSIYIRSHFEFTNSPDPYSDNAEIFIYTDEVPEDGSCDSCPPTPLPNFPGECNDITITPYLDFYTNDVSLETYDKDKDPSKLRLIVPPTDYPYIPDVQPCLLFGKLPGQGPVSGTCKVGYQVDLQWNETRDKLLAPIDLAPYSEKVIIGYRYDMMIELPRFYFKSEGADYTASLNIARIKTALGYSGDCVLEVRDNNNRGGWSQYFSATQANIYEADDTPITEASIHTLPVHRRTQDFYFRINSDSPFPLSVDSVTWEGNYSPRFYRRF